ncbi:MAG: Flp pilus assembly complex ATPase component TadA [Erysipelotrichaceae bacterium]|nr:Flp pilus assembly complex ATPase component TadA [Erysipelotrichaceae bacterium]MDY6034095.1 ATPase, T2SS/T4P/T4SS family [Bulleidia sp.]
MEERLVEILKIAVEFHVTDIHFHLKTYPKDLLSIEMKIENEVKQLVPKEDDIRLFHYLMYKSNLDLSDMHQPQTGRFEMLIDDKPISLRFALVSSYHTTSGVLRILNQHPILHVEDLCVDYDTTIWLRNITKHTSGLFVFSGPTGSGKTTTLYTLLNETKGKKIFTLEDPVEVYHENYVQIQINDHQHLSYDEGIKQLMRHNPDIIMIGEIRDSQAALMAVRSALTGHLVVTSLHSQNCLSTLDRLLDLGVDRYQLKDVLIGISNQRLFNLGEGKRVGIYEYMNQKEVEYALENHQVSQSFIPLHSKLQTAVAQGYLASDYLEEYTL